MRKLEARVTTDDRAPTLPVSATIWLIDGFNVLHASVLGGRDRAQWWNESHRAELLGRLREFDDPGAEIRVVFDGPGTKTESESESAASPPTERRASMRTVFAPSADDWLVARVRATPDPARVAVVTGDARVAGRARHWGANVVTPGEFIARCGHAAETASDPRSGGGPLTKE